MFIKKNSWYISRHNFKKRANASALRSTTALWEKKWCMGERVEKQHLRGEHIPET